MQVNVPALDRKARRKANRQQRAEGGRSIDLGKLQKRAESDTRVRCNLAEQAQHGTPTERMAARKAKRALNDNWTNRYSQSLTGFWNPNA